MLLAVVGHEDDVAVGGPDEPGQPEGIVGAGGRRLHGGHLVGLNTAQLGRRVQHADAAQQGGVHLEGHGDRRAHVSLQEPLPFPRHREGFEGHTLAVTFSSITRPHGHLRVYC